MARTGNRSLTGTAPISPNDPTHSAAILGGRVEMLFDGAGLSLAASVAIALVFVLVAANSGDVDTVHYAWLGTLGTITALRLGLGQLYRRRPALLDNTGWLHAFHAGAMLTAACWGLGGLIFFHLDRHVLQAFTTLGLAGIAAGALGVLAADFPTFRNYVAFSLAPLIVSTIWSQQQSQVVTGSLLALLMLLLLRMGHRASQSILDSLLLRYQNAGLVEDLEREKQRLVNEAETMMSTVLSSVPIALWAIDMHGAITFIDGKCLEEQTGVRLPAIGDNLLQRFAQHAEIVSGIRRAMSGEEAVMELDLNGHAFEVHCNPQLDPGGRQIGVMGVAIDISERKSHEAELIRRANYDELTGLANRALAMEDVKGAMARARRSSKSLALFFVDVDNLKSVNDTLGHNSGDQLLCETASRLQSSLRESDCAARLSGDEFLVIAEELHSPEDAEAIAHKIADLFRRPFSFEGLELFASASIGIAIYPNDADDPHQLLQCADTAMYHSKRRRKGGYRFFTQEMQQELARHLAIETALHHALERDELQLHYQPKLDTERNCISGAEALLRWNSRDLGWVPPDQFIPVAEMAGIMPQIGEWVLRQACREAATWQSLQDQPIDVAINVSAQQFHQNDLLSQVTLALADSGLPASRLELEITESLLMQDSPKVKRALRDLSSMGIALALDDFGTGYSSLSYLRKFPLDVLKIDKTFVQDICNDQSSESLIYTIIAMARSLHMTTVAEGVETMQQLQYLQARGADFVQGYLFSRPLPANEFRALLARSLHLPAQSEPQVKQLGRPLVRSG